MRRNTDLTLSEIEIEYPREDNCGPVLSETHQPVCCGFRLDANKFLNFMVKCFDDTVCVTRTNDQLVSEKKCCCKLCYQRTKEICEWVLGIAQNPKHGSDDACFVVVEADSGSYVLCSTITHYILLSIEKDVGSKSYKQPAKLFQHNAFDIFLRYSFSVSFEPISRLSIDQSVLRDGIRILKTSCGESKSFDLLQGDSTQSSSPDDETKLPFDIHPLADVPSAEVAD